MDFNFHELSYSKSKQVSYLTAKSRSQFIKKKAEINSQLVEKYGQNKARITKVKDVTGPLK